MNYKKILLSLFIFPLIVFAPNIQGQSMLPPGNPDPTFGTNGRVLTQLAGGCVLGDLILLPDGKIVAVCPNSVSVQGITRQNLLLLRYNSDGSPDNDFGVNGVKTIFVADGSSPFYSKKLYLQADGKILIVGHFNDDFAMLRVNADGSIDTSFGVNGRTITDFSGFEENSYDYLVGLAIRPDGKLLLYGTSRVQNLTFSCTPSTNPFCYPPEFERLALAQYDANGSPDLSFGERGIQRSRLTEDRHFAFSLVNEPADKFTFIVGVYERVLQTNGWESLFTHLAVRYKADGSIDQDFGKNGFKELPNAEFHPLPDGKFLTLETCQGFPGCTGYNTRFMRFNSDLTRDTTFGANGFAPYSLYYREHGAIYPQPDGKFIFSSYWVVGGFGSAQAYTYFYRFNSDGGMDFSFGSNGVIGFDLDGDNVLGSYAPPKFIFQPDGKLIAAGYFEPPQNTPGIRGIAMMRFIGRNSKF